MFYFIVWMVIICVCSLYKNSLNCALMIYVFFCMYTFKDSIYKNIACILVIYCSVTNYLETTAWHIYYHAVSMGQEPRQGFTGSSGSLWVSPRLQSSQGSTRKDLYPLHSWDWWQDSVPCWLLVRVRSSWAIGRRSPFILCPVGLSIEHLTT